ncbi:MAG: symmetrical bis(5'-nucleosyl)-tetraphosphatase [Formivibrio sp.]|nr:symmetrical bis(5'-nucleosyl)-tetraphosphatase [Formivibrio sp.]
MARYAIGDIQGCFNELLDLLEKIGYSAHSDRLYLVGDLVNRGPASLDVLRWAFDQQQHVSIVLGNHDLHLLACSTGASKVKRGDTLDAILQAKDASMLLEWLRKQPLLIALEDALIVHAGILPVWNEAQAIGLANEVSSMLASKNYQWFLSNMYGNQPQIWKEDLVQLDRLRLAVNAFTRMRMVNSDGGVDFKFKGELDKAPASLLPWFAYPKRVSTRRVVCGHWSALGLLMSDSVWSLDTGCVWGGKLTAVCLDDGEVFQVQASCGYQALSD